MPAVCVDTWACAYPGQSALSPRSAGASERLSNVPDPWYCPLLPRRVLLTSAFAFLPPACCIQVLGMAESGRPRQPERRCECPGLDRRTWRSGTAEGELVGGSRGDYTSNKSARWALVSPCEQGGAEATKWGELYFHTRVMRGSSPGYEVAGCEYSRFVQDLFRIGESANLGFWVGV